MVIVYPLCRIMMGIMSPPTLFFLPPYAESAAQVMAASSTPVLCGRSRRLIRNLFIDDEAKEGIDEES